MNGRALALTGIRTPAAALASVLACALALILLALALWPAHAPRALPPVSTAPSQRELAGLPLSAQGPVSAALGADGPAYRLMPTGRGSFAAANPAQRLTATFGPSGVEIRAAGITLAMRLLGAGPGTTVATRNPDVHANRAAYPHPGVREWYANGPLGIEQGFTLQAPPRRSDDGQRTLTLAFSSNAKVTLASGGQALTLRRHGFAPLRYGGLIATDARGRVLTSRMSLRRGRLRLLVNARGAAYPLRIDPLVQQGEMLTGGAEEVDETRLVHHEGGVSEEAVARGELGYSVALSSDGNTALVGAPNDAAFTGAAWVFVRVGGEWVQQGPKLTAGETEHGEACTVQSEESEGCAFGRSVALSGDGNTALIGAPRQEEACPGEPASMCANQGAVWVFTRSGSAWTRSGSLTGGPEEVLDGRFGRSVAISADGSTAIVGAPADRVGRGSVWMFSRSGASWSHLGSRIEGVGEIGEGHFGGAVAVSGDGTAAIVGAPGNAGYLGGAWMLSRSGATVAEQQLPVSEPIGGPHFGAAVAIAADGTTALVGGRLDGGGRGAAWLFARSGGGWVQQGPKLTGGEEVPPGDEAQLGSSVALSADGTVALVGAAHDEGDVGSAWLYSHSGGTVMQEGAKLIELASAGPAPRDGGLFGSGVALRADGRTALVGAPGEGTNAGAVFALSDPGLIPVITGVAPAVGPLAGGTSVRISGERLGAAQAVRFGGVPAAGFSAEPDGTLTAITPKGLGPGSVCVEVRTAEGISPSPCLPEARFRYLPVPHVSYLSPAFGSTAGGTSVAIVGGGFTEASTVRFGSLPASHVVYEGEGTLVATSPPAPEGDVNVTVTTLGGTSPRGPGNAYLYVAPSELGAGGGPGSGEPGSGGPPGTSGTGAVLAAGPAAAGGGPPSAGACATLASRTVEVLGGSRARVKLLRRPAGTCHGRLLLTIRQTARARGHTVLHTRTIASGGFSVSHGRVRIATVKLNALGRSLLRAGHGRLSASISLFPPRGRALLARATSVRLIARVSPSRSARGG
jgi:hypothetical protein